MRRELNQPMKSVYIPSRVQHEGIYGMTICLYWVCPVCGKPRGTPDTVRSYDGSRILYCQGWVNPCGHIDKYEQVREEARDNGLNYPGQVNYLRVGIVK
jgi:hypothetical protein